MRPVELEQRIASLNVWRRGDERAPHKPLLLLLALGAATRGEPRLHRFSEIADKLAGLLRDFGPPRKRVHPEFPFWHLQSDEIWEVKSQEKIGSGRGGHSPSKRELLECEAVGGFTQAVAKVLAANPTLPYQLAQQILTANFPSSLHEELLSAVGLDGMVIVPKRKRSSTFRSEVLRAYEHRCAVCGLDMRLEQATLALDAAHINGIRRAVQTKW